MGQRRLLMRTVREHLIQNGRDSRLRVWKGPRNRDSSDEEWKDKFRTLTPRNHVVMDAEVDTPSIVYDTFQQTDNTCTIEDRV
jgi:hypothetical protein